MTQFFRGRNGYIPEGDLVVFKRGRNSTDGNWFHGFPPATYARHLALLALAFALTGRRLELSDGFAAYRPYAIQVIARAIYGDGAAWPGTSSHGLYWEGRDTAAGDYGNWAWVYQHHGGRAQFFAHCRQVGLLPDMISPGRGYPDEPWHVIDPDPWSAIPAFAGAVGVPFQPGAVITPPPPIYPEEPFMYVRATTAGSYARAGIVYDNSRGGVWRGLTDLEEFVVKGNPGVKIADMSGPDVDLLFAVAGLAEQELVVNGPPWGAGEQRLDGLGTLTGRVVYPGAPDHRSEWRWAGEALGVAGPSAPFQAP